MMVSEDLSRGEWELRITEIRHSDAGNYECQINTNPLLSHTISLSVVGLYQFVYICKPLTPLFQSRTQKSLETVRRTATRSI